MTPEDIAIIWGPPCPPDGSYHRWAGGPAIGSVCMCGQKLWGCVLDPGHEGACVLPPEPIHSPTLDKAVEALKDQIKAHVDAWNIANPGCDYTDIWFCHINTLNAAINALEALRPSPAQEPKA